LFQGALAATTQLWQEVERGGRRFHEIMAKSYPPGIHQAMAYECANGEWLHLSIISGLTPLRSVDEVIGGPSDDTERRAMVRGWDRAKLIDALRDANHAVEAIVPAHEVLDHPQTIANRMVVNVAGTRQMGVPIHLQATPGRVGAASPGPARPSATPAPVSGAALDAPLSGIRVIDVGQYLAGPFAPMVLGDLGADVIKIEPVTGDNMRLSAKPFIGCQRSKRSIALDLKHPRGREIALELIAGADIVHHNMTRGVASRLGIDYDACRTVRSDVIYCNTYAYGPDEPLGRFGGLDPIFQASAGIEYDAGAVAAGGSPLYIRFGLCDTSNAMLSAIGVLIALVHRQRTGEGQELWTSLHDGGIFMSADVWTEEDGTPWPRPALDAGQHGLGPGYRLYRTSGDGWICVAAVGERQFARLCEVVAPDLAPADLEHDFSGLEAAFLTRTARLWHLALDDAGVPNEIPLDTNEGEAVMHDDDNVRLGLVTEHDHPVLGRLRHFGKLLSCAVDATPPPMVGQHSREVLHEVGYGDDAVDDLVGAGVVYEPDDGYRWPN
jgi:crotonobetainyl-CoA:carnitine CoA-transferase CaiB-like acyl-CoA transferase